MESLKVVRCWVDASYNTQKYYRYHSGAMMSLGKGAILISPLKKQLNVKSSTEGGILGSQDRLIVVLCSKHFI